MALTKTFAGSNGTNSSGTTLSVTGISTTGYTNAIMFCKHEGATATITPSDSQTSTWNSSDITKINHSNSDLSAQMFYCALAGTSASESFTMTLSASRQYRSLGIWLVNASAGGDIVFVAEATAQGSTSSVPETIDGGTLSNSGSDSVLGFLGVGEYNTNTYTPGTGWSEDQDGFGSLSTYAESIGVVTDSSIDPTVQVDDNTMDWIIISAIFKEATGGGGGPATPQGLHWIGRQIGVQHSAALGGMLQ